MNSRASVLKVREWTSFLLTCKFCLVMVLKNLLSFVVVQSQRYVADVGKSWPVLIVCGGLIPLFLSIIWLFLIRHFVAAMPWITVVFFNMLLISVTIFCYLKGWYKKLWFLLCVSVFVVIWTEYAYSIFIFIVCSWMDWEWCCDTYYRWAWPILSCIWSSKFNIFCYMLLSSSLRTRPLVPIVHAYLHLLIHRSWHMSVESPFWWLLFQLLLSSLQSPSSAEFLWQHQSSRWVLGS